ncbi:MAG TPA: hypothetical protein VKB79_07735 [Bryobacteraceae bacterium]|nr:hypothetical protein [Bryobacteraceae bacterium]
MHPVAMQITEIIPEAFHAALVLTGSVEGAERTLIDATARIASDGSREAFLAETARAAATHEAVPDKSPLLIPRELQALFLLPTTCRYCFVLLVLLRFDLETCSQILNLSADDVKEALDQSLLDLPKVQSAMCRAGIN